MTTKKKKKLGRLAKALLETAGDMRKAGLLGRATYDKITMRHLGATGARQEEPGGVRPPSEPDGGLCVSAGTRREASDRGGACASERHQAQGHRRHFVRSAGVRRPPTHPRDAGTTPAGIQVENSKDLDADIHGVNIADETITSI